MWRVEASVNTCRPRTAVTLLYLLGARPTDVCEEYTHIYCCLEVQNLLV